MTKQTKHILLISPFALPNIGGIETHIELLSRYLAQHHYHVTLLTYQPLTTGEHAPRIEKHEGLEIRRYSWVGYNLFSKLQKYPHIFNFLYLTPYLLVRSFIFMLARPRRYQLMHVFGLNAGMVGRILKMLFQIPVVLTTKGVYDFYGYTLFGKVTRWLLNGLDAILVGTLDSRDDFLNLGIERERLISFTHWIDHTVFKPEKLSKKASHFTVIYQGRLIPEKGIELIVEVAEQMPAVQFKIVGEGILRDYVMAAGKRLKNVQYLGIASDEKRAMYLQAADVSIFPATYREDVSLAILESLACGTPVVSSFHGSGIYHMPADVADIVDPTVKDYVGAIAALQKDTKRHKHMAAQAHMFAKKFSENNAKTILDIYESLILR